jgi:hypothetical protein
MKKKIEIGNKFGKLLAIEEVKERKSGGIRYKCLCDCGNTHEVFATHLRRGLITHCGCVRHEGAKHQQWKGAGEISGDFWYSHIVRSANGSKGNRVKKELTLTIQEAWDLFLKQRRKCALSGVRLTFPKRSKDKSYTASLDRIDSSKGYVLGNVQWIHKDINIMKNKFDNEYFINVCREVCVFHAKEDTIKSKIPLHEQGIDILDEIESDTWLKL